MPATALVEPTGRAVEILESAHRLMVEQGMKAVTMRGVARATGISPGNLAYHFPTLDALLDALMRSVLAPYLNAFARLRESAGGDPFESLRAVLSYVLDDLASKETTLFFPELWALANRDAAVARHMDALYSAYIAALADLIEAARPDLQADQVAELALFICASIEGQTVFIGYERTYGARRSGLKELALVAMLDAVRSR